VFKPLQSYIFSNENRDAVVVQYVALLLCSENGAASMASIARPTASGQTI
jgi:hypothetical protein